jgi:hypothetical protein
MALTMWVTGVGDPILFGTALGVLIFLLAGPIDLDALWQAPLFGRWLHLAIFSRGENQPLSEARANRISTFIFDPPLFATADTPHNQIQASSGLSGNCPKIGDSNAGAMNGYDLRPHHKFSKAHQRPDRGDVSRGNQLSSLPQRAMRN